MPTKRCEICGKSKKLDENSICCSDCEEKELDLLIAAYAYIHCYDADFCPFQDLIEGVPPIDGISLNQTFIRNWLLKNWLDKNELNSLCVPEALYEDILDNGFKISDMIRVKLNIQKKQKKPIDIQN
ncbi:MAG: hypothetical protein JXR73_21100, partial [Candidatus Omnitrophica bacterium]|nr:hypothetical protein [Candidatus Omnitrophota bacterium]